MKRVAASLALLMALPGPAMAERVRALGSYIFPPVMSEAEACQQAESRARADAIRQVTGETLAAEEIMRCAEQGDETECSRNSVVWTMLGGEIRNLQNRRSETTVEAEGFRKCSVSFEAEVHVAQGKPDPGFDLGVALNNAVYRDGEKLAISLTPTQPMMVQVFQWLPYEKDEAQIVRIFPNRFDATGRVEGAATIPSAAGAKRYELKLAFPAAQPAGRKMVDEYLMVVATRKPVALRDSYSLDDFNRALAEIAPSDRRLVRKAYAIVRGRE